jgi:hypothetical protein
MPDLTAKRTLVKSPPELWEELSEVERLAKHLGAFGEITITKLEPEHTVAWEGERASGTVSIEPSGWGTKVTLRAELPESEEPEAVEPDPPEPEPAAAEPESDPAVTRTPEAPITDPNIDAPVASAEAQHIGRPEGDQRVELLSEAVVREKDPVPNEEGPEPDARAGAVPPEPKPRRGFWGWLFRSRTEPVTQTRKPVATETEPVAAGEEPEPMGTEPESEPVAAEPAPDPLAAETVSEPVAVEPVEDPEPVAAEPEPEPVAAEPEPEPVAAESEPEAASAAPDAEADAVADVDALDLERVRVILDEALDALGAAHHRPFSRG